MALVPVTFPFLYVYKHKRAVHIRVALSWLDVETEYWRSSARASYPVPECEALGVPKPLLVEYYSLSRDYFSARMVMNQNRPSFPKQPMSDELADLLGPYLADMESIRKFRYTTAQSNRNRAWAKMGVLRKKMRALLPAL
jgi:hypothetical protein